MSCKTDKPVPESMKPKNESKPSAIKERVLPQQNINVKAGEDKDEET